MTYRKQSYVEHVAIFMKDIDWHIRFFREVLGMALRKVEGPADDPVQVWTIGGIQLKSAPGFEGPEGRMAHLGIMTEDLEAALDEAKAWGVRALPQGPNWLALPDGLEVEIMQAMPGAVGEALAVSPYE